MSSGPIYICWYNEATGPIKQANMPNINFHLRDLKAQTAQKVKAIFFVENKMIRISTNQYIHPDNWSDTKKQAKVGLADSAKINKLLKEQKDYLGEIVEKVLNVLKRDKKRFHREAFQTQIQEAFNQHFKIGEVKQKTEGQVVDFITFIDKYIKDNQDKQEGTLQTYRGTRKNILLAFDLVPRKLVQQWENMNVRERKLNPDFLAPNRPVDFDEIDEDWMQRFKNWLLQATFTEKKNGIEVKQYYSKNYIAKEIAIAKRFAIAAEGKYIKNSSFRKVSASWEDADTVHLDWNELASLKTLDLEPFSMDGKVRNLMVFNSYLGLRYGDLNSLDKDRFADNDGQLALKIRLKKTDELVHFPILPSAEEILKMYNYELPTVCEPTFNEVIKKLCMFAGINKIEHKRETRGGKKVTLKIPKYMMISTHTGRRSFATNFEADNVPVPELMLVTGHTTEKSFRKYVKKKEQSHFKGFLAVGVNR